MRFERLSEVEKNICEKDAVNDSLIKKVEIMEASQKKNDKKFKVLEKRLVQVECFAVENLDNKVLITSVKNVRMKKH